jgi:hypothetical protein
MYDLGVRDDHTFFVGVGETRVLVHNAFPCGQIVVSADDEAASTGGCTERLVVLSVDVVDVLCGGALVEAAGHGVDVVLDAA